MDKDQTVTYKLPKTLAVPRYFNGPTSTCDEMKLIRNKIFENCLKTELFVIVGKMTSVDQDKRADVLLTSLNRKSKTDRNTK